MAKKILQRCRWAGDDPLMQAYHDEEWGVPLRDSRMLWEMLMLPAGCQSTAFIKPTTCEIIVGVGLEQ